MCILQHKVSFWCNNEIKAGISVAGISVDPLSCLSEEFHANPTFVCDIRSC